MSHQNQNNSKLSLRVNSLLSVLYALIGEVSPPLRAVRIKWDEKIIHLFFYYDGEISEEDRESAENIATEVIANFSEHVLEVNIQRLDYPKPIPEIGELAYSRREKVPKEALPP